MNENKTNINWYPGHMAKTIIEISIMKAKNVYELIKNEDLCLDILFASELVKYRRNK